MDGTTVTLGKSIRLFECTSGIQLTLAGQILPAGAKIVIGDAEKMIYDHRDQSVFSIDIGKETTYWILESELEVRTDA